MKQLSRELLESTIADWEVARDEIPFGLDEEGDNTLAALKFALSMLDSHSGDIAEKVNSPVTPDCWCRTCRPVTLNDMRFVVCPECGNKRCPRANNHRHACSGSNEPGQEGSAFRAPPKDGV